MISNRRFSLWLMPEEPHFTKLKRQQDRIIATNPSLPTFDPHVTLIGGVEICKCCKIEDIKKTTGTSTMEDIDKEAAKIVLNRLQSAFKGFGDVVCEFDETKQVRAMFQKDGTVKWNQACVSVIKQTLKYMDAMRTADDALFGEEGLNVSRHLRQPVLEPHYSFVYTDDAIFAKTLEQTLQCPSSFRCKTIAMWWTDPPTLDAVRDRKWEFIDNIYLSESKL